MRRFLFLLAVALLLLAQPAGAEGYRVTDVIEVGPASSFLAGPSLKWSPDGALLAYFADGRLMVSDTLGQSREVAEITDMYPGRAEWASATELAVDLMGQKRADSTPFQLVLFNIDSNESKVVEQFWRTKWSHLPGHSYYEGPYLSMEGKAYYVHVQVTGLLEGDMKERLLSRQWLTERRSFSRASSALSASWHTIRRREGGLYMVNLDGEDSTRLCADPCPGVAAAGVTVSPGGSMVFSRGRLYRVSDSTTVDVWAAAGTKPPNTTLCDDLFASFNPRGSEILFQYTCEGGESYVVDQVAWFDYVTNEFVIVDTLTGLSNCGQPTYAPDGRRIALKVGSRAYIIDRQEK